MTCRAQCPSRLPANHISRQRHITSVQYSWTTPPFCRLFRLKNMATESRFYDARCKGVVSTTRPFKKQSLAIQPFLLQHPKKYFVLPFNCRTWANADGDTLMPSISAARSTVLAGAERARPVHFSKDWKVILQNFPMIGKNSLPEKQMTPAG